MSANEIIIVGGGVLGCSTAYHLAQQGFASKIIEKDSIAEHASGRAWATISVMMTGDMFQGIGQPFGTVKEEDRIAKPFRPFIKDTFNRIPEMAERLKDEAGMDIQFAELPGLYVVFSEDDEKFCKYRVNEIQKEGEEIAWVSGDDVKSLYGDIHPAVRGGITFPGLQLEPYRYTLALVQAAEKKGAEVRQGEVVDFTSQGSRVTSLTLSSGTKIEGDVFILTMGPWIGRGTAILKKEIKVRPMKWEWLRLKPPKPLPNYRLGAAEITLIPKPDGTTIVGEGALSGGISVPQADGSVKPGEPFPVDWQDEFNDAPTNHIEQMYSEAAVTTLPRMEDADLTEHILHHHYTVAII